MKTYKLKVVSTKVSGTNSDFPAYVDLSELPASFWSLVTNGGGDIRCWSSVEPPSVQLPREVVSCSTASDTGELWVKTSMTTTTEIYITIDGSSSEPAVDSDYGSENVWNSNYKAIYHLDDADDSSDNDNDLTAVSSPSAVAGKLGKAYSFDGVDDELVDTTFTNFGNTNFTIQMWVNVDSISEAGAFFKLGSAAGKDGVALGVGTTRLEPAYLGNKIVGLVEDIRWISTGDDLGTGWQRLELQINSSGYPEVFLNGVSVYSDTTGTLNDPVDDFQIGGYTTGGSTSRHVDALIDEVHVISGNITSDWRTTEYNNQNDASEFWDITEINQVIKRWSGSAWVEYFLTVFVKNV